MLLRYQVILNIIGKGMTLLEAFKSPRLHSQLLADYVDVENQTLVIGTTISGTDRMRAALWSRGHNNVSSSGGSMGVAQFISIDPDTGLMEAVSDPRKNGQPCSV